ncbi:MAG: class I SAM-dependent methyltransferase [Candidatus Methylarchaceae archaeon HK01M]|nr:class I SAM-dependent methyltransferase [Candidatus Methylarchaceae archaeon HK01M]
MKGLDLWSLLIIILLILLTFQIVVRIWAKFHPSPIPSPLLRILDIPLRDAVVKGEELLKRSGLKSRQKVLEVGCGTGFYTVKATEIIKEGEVHALDLQSLAIDKVRGKIKEGKIENLMLIKADAQNLPFKDEVFELAFMVTVMGEIPDKETALKELNRVLKLSGLLSVTEFLPDPHYLMRRTLSNLVEGSGFSLIEYHGNLFCYTVNFQKEL